MTRKAVHGAVTAASALHLFGKMAEQADTTRANSAGGLNEDEEDEEPLAAGVGVVSFMGVHTPEASGGGCD